jgi:selenophosphate synthetase-related protein
MIQDSNRKVDAYVIDIDGKLLVRPSVVVLKQHDEFQLCNLTNNNDVQVCFGEPANAADWLQVDDKKKRGQVMAMTPGVYRYHVRVAGRPAHGESDPVIIIDPPGN